MTTTPPPPAFQNALTEYSITPLCAKMTSVPLDGRVFKATTLDAELSTELEDATIFKVASGSRNNYVVSWCQRSGLNLSGIKAGALRTADDKPLFRNGCWEPSLIPHTLHKFSADSIENLGSSSSRASQSQSLHSTAKLHAGSSTSKGHSRTSLRREPITRKIPHTKLEETIEATVIPITGSEENSIATWLNKIVSASTRLLGPHSQSHPELEGLRLTRSMSKVIDTPSTQNNLRLWSSQYATKPVENSPMSFKPDIVFCGQLDPYTGFVWRNVISFFKLTSSNHSAQLRRDITWKVYAVFMSQPNRHFVVALSLARQEFCLQVFDHSGVIHSLGSNIHRSADLFVHVVYTLAFGSLDALGFDPTFIDPSLSPSLLFCPCSIVAFGQSRMIYIRKNAYTVVRHIFVSYPIQGRATSSWLVKRGNKLYVIKDYWTHKGRKHTEEEILLKIKGLLGVPQLVEAWTVQIENVDETTNSL